MTGESRFAPLTNVVHKLEVFLGRKPVQLQLLTLTLAVCFAFAVTRAFWFWALPRALRLAARIRQSLHMPAANRALCMSSEGRGRAG